MSNALHARCGPWLTAAAADGGWVSMRVERRMSGTRWVVVTHQAPLGRACPMRVLLERRDPQAAQAAWAAAQIDRARDRAFENTGEP